MTKYSACQGCGQQKNGFERCACHDKREAVDLQRRKAEALDWLDQQGDNVVGLYPDEGHWNLEMMSGKCYSNVDLLKAIEAAMQAEGKRGMIGDSK